MQLEIKHLTSYLPCEVRFISSMDKPFDEYGKNPIWILDGINKMFGDYCLLTKENNDAYTITSCKLLLRPLSSADDWIRQEFEKYHAGKECDKNVINFFDIDVIGVESIMEIEIEYLPYGAIQCLLKNHFDIEKLIDNGLAINLETIK